MLNGYNIANTTTKKEKSKLDGTNVLGILLSTFPIALIIYYYKYHQSHVRMINLFNPYNNPIRCIQLPSSLYRGRT